MRGNKVTRCDAKPTDWLEAFAKKMKESANIVEQGRARNQAYFNQTFIDQISNILSLKSSKNTEAKVQEYQDKTGLLEYLRRISAAEEKNKKTAQELPESFNKLPNDVIDSIKNFIINKCKTHHGNIQVPALVEEVSRTFRQYGLQPQDVNDMIFEKFVNDEIIKAKKNEPSADEHNANIGLGVGVDNTNIDPANTDIFEGLTPAKIST